MALTVLAEKLNVQGVDKSCLTPVQKTSACLKIVEQQFKKVCTVYMMFQFSLCVCVCVWLVVLLLSLSLSCLQEFTLEFSRDRKSMSVYCRPTGEDASSPVMFVKVSSVSSHTHTRGGEIDL